jgi:hypothetical protein
MSTTLKEKIRLDRLCGRLGIDESRALALIKRYRLKSSRSGSMIFANIDEVAECVRIEARLHREAAAAKFGREVS